MTTIIRPNFGPTQIRSSRELKIGDTVRKYYRTKGFEEVTIKGYFTKKVGSAMKKRVYGRQEVRKTRQNVFC